MHTKIPLAQRHYILQALQFLASTDDGAATQDTKGFARNHSALGNMLARKAFLNDREAQAGRLLVRFYKRQVSAHDASLYDNATTGLAGGQQDMSAAALTAILNGAEIPEAPPPARPPQTTTNDPRNAPPRPERNETETALLQLASRYQAALSDDVATGWALQTLDTAPSRGWTSWSAPAFSERDFLQYGPELRELGRLKGVAEVARDGSPLADKRALDVRTPLTWGSDKLALGPFESEVAMRNYGATCREAEVHIDRAGKRFEGDLRREAVQRRGQLPLVMSYAHLLLTEVVGGRATPSVETALSEDISRHLGDHPKKPAVEEALKCTTALSGSEKEWKRLQALCTELEKPENHAHFLVAANPNSDREYKPAEVEGLHFLGRNFAAAYGKMSGDQRRAVWLDLKKRLESGRSDRSAMGIFVALVHGISRTDREQSALEIREMVVGKSEALRVNAAAVEERLRHRDQAARTTDKRFGNNVRQELERSGDLLCGTYEEASRITRLSGFGDLSS